MTKRIEMPNIPFQECDGPLFHRPVEELLRIETHHRLMNTLAILGATLERELKLSDPRSRVALDRLVRIIIAHSALHRCLALGTPRGPVAIGEYVKNLSRCLSEAVLEPMGVTCETVTDEGFMPAVQAERLGLVLCELAINAAKHGFPDKRTGMLEASRVLLRVELDAIGTVGQQPPPHQLGPERRGEEHPQMPTTPRPF